MNLAARLRPQTLKEFIGQTHLVGPDKILEKMIRKNKLSSIIFWGPPGTGKTTLAHIIANETKSRLYELSGVESGKNDLLKIINLIKQDKSNSSLLFIDEIHRWNKAQQDTLLPYVENGLITLIGATTENPSFEIISALLSRSRVFTLQKLSEKELSTIIKTALTDKEQGVGKYEITLTPDAIDLLIRLSGGDARTALNALELAVTSQTTQNKNKQEQNKSKTRITPQLITDIFQTKSTSLYDKKGEEHYNITSAFIKSMRASQPDAALHYLARMIEGGEDPKFIARRMVIFASEDIGMAQPTALVVANEVFRAVETIGYPECSINLTHGAIYLATAKKDRSIADSLEAAISDVRNFPNEPVPLHLRNAPTKLMKDLGFAKDYNWQQGRIGIKKGLSYLPEKLKEKKYYKSKQE